ncbi:MAG: ParA family protein [Deltaproteobacteria bacterium]|nr:ParA family protein [Deltaproteobacteria bacterium]
MIDVPAGAKRERIEEIVRFAHVIVVPVMPSAFDEMGTRSFLERLSELKPIRRGRRGIATIGNRIRPRTRATARLDAFLSSLAFPAVARLRDSSHYAEASVSGITLFDMPKSKAGAALSDWDPLLLALRLHAAG